ncbi:MAG: ABC transporter permease, partial [Firmicutes bacterium]|nr:ABC transporter permease [Bacillota bacterium]
MIQITKRQDIEPKKANRMRALAIVAALVLAAVIMAALGYNPFEVYKNIVVGSLKIGYRLRETVNKAIPLTVLSLGVSVAFKMKFWNIGAEGQFYMGAYGAALAAFGLAPETPSFVTILLMFVLGFLFGGIWAMIPALLKAKFNTSETLVTLMLNYIAIGWISYLQYGPWKDPAATGFPKIANFTDNAVLPRIFGAHAGWIIALVIALFIHILMKYSKLGYEISVLGESETTARYAGMNVFKIMFIAVFISGGLCGAAGMIQASA